MYELFWHCLILLAQVFSGGLFIATAARFARKLKVMPTWKEYYVFGIHVMLSIWSITTLIRELIIPLYMYI